jgi:hypothetical protein
MGILEYVSFLLDIFSIEYIMRRNNVFVSKEELDASSISTAGLAGGVNTGGFVHGQLRA